MSYLKEDHMSCRYRWEVPYSEPQNTFNDTTVKSFCLELEVGEKDKTLLPSFPQFIC